jgi:peptidoglycan hydrolase CwlO-like protein
LIAAALLLGFILALPVLSPVQAATSATLKQQLAAKQATLDQAYAKLDALQDELNKLAGAYDEAESNQGALEEEILQVQERITGSEKELQGARLQLEDRLVGMGPLLLGRALV